MKNLLGWEDDFIELFCEAKDNIPGAWQDNDKVKTKDKRWRQYKITKTEIRKRTGIESTSGVQYNKHIDMGAPGARHEPSGTLEQTPGARGSTQEEPGTSLPQTPKSGQPPACLKKLDYRKGLCLILEVHLSKKVAWCWGSHKKDM